MMGVLDLVREKDIKWIGIDIDGRFFRGDEDERAILAHCQGSETNKPAEAHPLK